MWIENLANGKYKYCERYEDPITGRTKRVCLTHTKKTKGVQEEMVLKLQEKITKALNAPKADIRISFSELVEKWWIVYSESVKGQSLVTRKNQINVVNKKIGDVQVRKINAVMLNRLLLEMTENGRAYRTVEGYKGLLVMILKYGFKYGYFREDMSNDLSINRIRVAERNELKYLEHDEIKSLIHQLYESKRPEVARLCHIQILTGMRIGELISIDFKQHIDFNNKTILIERTYNQAMKSFGTTKTGQSRTINFNTEIETLLKEQITHTRLKVMKYKLPRDISLLFMTRTGNVIDDHYINKILKNFDINGKNVTTHYFRHTFITLMVENNVPLNLIAEHVGHTNTEMIQKVYNHFSNRMKDDLKQAINDLSLSV